MPGRAAIRRLPGDGWLALVGGGEFSFGETLAADRAWLERAPAGSIGFLPTASGSDDYGRHLASYFADSFERTVETVPIYRARDARRAKNLERLDRAAVLYLGGGIADQLVDVLAESPALERIQAKLAGSGLVVAIAAAAHAAGRWVRGLTGRELLPGLGWLPDTVIETNFDPGHDRRLRQLMRQRGVVRGLGLPAGSCLLLGPPGEGRLVGTAFVLEDPEGDYDILSEETPPS